MATVKLYMKSGRTQCYNCADKWTTLYISRAKQYSIDEEREDDHFVISGEVIEKSNDFEI